MLDDRQLLRRYAADRSETAFGELVARYIVRVLAIAVDVAAVRSIGLLELALRRVAFGE